jgi:hypothetical protein
MKLTTPAMGFETFTFRKVRSFADLSLSYRRRTILFRYAALKVYESFTAGCIIQDEENKLFHVNKIKAKLKPIRHIIYIM